MQVFKFGGASVKNAEAIKNVASIIKTHGDKALLVVVSAMGKTTNVLEAILEAYSKSDKNFKHLYQELKDQHIEIIDSLFSPPEVNKAVHKQLSNVWLDLEKQFDQSPTADYNFLYDQIVSAGELLSTILVAAYLNESGLKTHWFDVRRLIKTDNTYREGIVDWPLTKLKTKEKLKDYLNVGEVVLTQGFLGGTKEGFTTTLGREGSDYTAAVFSNVLDAESMSVWKDVPGILSADPRRIPDAELIHQLSYAEAIEMTYYGAKVIHPKTIKPLQNKSIPLRVRSFTNPETEGTTIAKVAQEKIPPVIVFNPNQVMIKVTTKDFSYIMEEHLSMIYAAFAKQRIKTNISQNGAISFRACVDNVDYKIYPLMEELETHFNLNVIRGLELLTIRHYNEATIQEQTKGRTVILEQKAKQNIQLILTK